MNHLRKTKILNVKKISKKTTKMTNEQILQMCYEKHTEFEESSENDEFFLDNPVFWPFCYEIQEFSI